MSSLFNETYWSSLADFTRPEDEQWFPSYGKYNVYFGAESRSDPISYIGESLVDKTLSVYTLHPGIVVYYTYTFYENSGWWGDNEGYDAQVIETIDGVAHLTLTRDIYALSVLCNEYDFIRVTDITIADNTVWKDFINTVEVNVE